MKIVVGVMGSSGGRLDETSRARLVRLGRAIAEHECTLMTGACPGLPYAAVQGARAAGGLVVGVSPALSRAEHEQRYGSPVDGFDVLIYTGSGLMGREVDTIRSSDIVILAGGRSGTLGEFAIAYDEGGLIGVLTGTGGVADAVAQLVDLCDKPTGARVVYDSDPERLLDRVLACYHAEHRAPPRPAAEAVIAVC